MSTTSPSSEAVERARQYYNSDDADRFYFSIWGGEDIHIGLYERPDEDIAKASQRTVATMALHLQDLPKGARVLDLGAGYGGSARYLASRHGFHMTALNLSEVENERNRTRNRQIGLHSQIDVVDGNFEELPFPVQSFDAAWSQDAMLHSGNRRQVFGEVDRVLRAGGVFVFTDILQKDGVKAEELQPVYDRIHLDSLGSRKTYDNYATELGWKKVAFTDLSQHLPTHYQRVHDLLQSRQKELSAEISNDYINRMSAGLLHWVRAGKAGNLAWGISVYQKTG